MAVLKDRRRFKRNPVELVIHCYLPAMQRGLKNRFKALAKDISPKGVKLIVSRDVRIGEEIVLLLEKPIALVPILVKGRIIWLNKMKEHVDEREIPMEIGVEFIHISSYGHESLGNLMEEVEAHNRLTK